MVQEKKKPTRDTLCGDRGGLLVLDRLGYGEEPFFECTYTIEATEAQPPRTKRVTLSVCSIDWHQSSGGRVLVSLWVLKTSEAPECFQGDCCGCAYT